jgi:hypothetical protein
MEQSNADSFINVETEVKFMCSVNSWSMFAIIFPNVISFLLIDDDDDDDDDEDDDALLSFLIDI